jgi:hypothetical protein
MARPRTLLATLATALALVAAACAAGDPGGAIPDATTEAVPTTEANATTSTQGAAPAVTVLPQGTSALQDKHASDFPPPLVDPGDIFSGGPPPDGIPPIEDPEFLDVADNVDLLPQAEAVVALEIDGDARAYPVRAMVWHEIVNDTVGGVPVSVTYCPLCNSAATYERTIQGNVTSFGTSGQLYASALVMYDRATETLWTHFNGEAVVGLLTGTQLVEHPSPLLSWGEFVAAYPTGKVLDWEAAGFHRDYGRNPYSGYDTPDGRPFLFRGSLDDRAMAMQRVVGIDHGDATVAYAVQAVSGGGAKATNVALGSTNAVILWKSGQASALETHDQATGRDVGSFGVFDALLDGQQLTFSAVGELLVDDQTGSVWSVTGFSVEGELSGSQLDQIPHLDTFWFAWSTYQPDTSLISE